MRGGDDEEKIHAGVEITKTILFSIFFLALAHNRARGTLNRFHASALYCVREKKSKNPSINTIGVNIIGLFEKFS